jgi:LPXTG-site transpeptidase (sortase) family protein
MNQKVRENLTFVIEEDWNRFKKPILWSLFAVLLWVGVSALFSQIDEALGAVEIEGYEPENVLVPKAEQISRETKIFIPKIGVEAPILFVDSTDAKDFYGPLKKGVTHYPSSLPGEKGAAVILGHSAPAGVFKKEFNGVFSDLHELLPGDEIVVHYKGAIHRYTVQGQELLQKGQDVPQEELVATESKLVLLSCWPRGIDNKRIMVKAIAL